MSLGWLSIGAAGNISLTGLNVDNGTLYVNESENKVGVGNLNPESQLHVGKARTFSSSYSRMGTTITVTTPVAHNFTTGTIVKLYFLSGEGTSDTYSVTVTSSTQFTVEDVQTGVTAGIVDVTFDFYFMEEVGYASTTDSEFITVVMNQSGVSKHNFSVGDQVRFSFFTSYGTVTGTLVTGDYSPPLDTSGATSGDFFINTVNGDVYRFSGSWSYYRNLQTNSAGGPYTGANGFYTGSGFPAGGIGAINDFYVDQTNGYIYRKLSSGWTLVDTVLLTGFTTIYSAPSPPGNNGDIFIDTTSGGPNQGEFYYKSSGVWSLKGILWDPTGNTGLITNQLLSGYGVPASELGVENNMYLNRTNGDVYQKYPFGWFFVGNVLNHTPLSGTYRISSVSGDGNVFIVTNGWKVILGGSGSVRFYAPLSDSEKEGTNGVVFYGSNFTSPEMVGNVNFAGGIYIGSTAPYARNRGTAISLGGTTIDTKQITFSKLSGVQSADTDLRSGDMVMETLYDRGPDTYMFERMRIKGNGNVGIGTNNPQWKLDVWGGDYAQLRVKSTTSLQPGQLIVEGFDGNTQGQIQMVTRSDSIGISHIFAYKGGPDLLQLNNNLYLTGTGGVGIGTTDPLRNLHIWGISGAGIQISSSSSIYGRSSVDFRASINGDGSSNFHAGSITSVSADLDTNCKLEFRIGSAETTVATMAGNGDLDITGSYKKNGGLMYQAGSINLSGTVLTAGRFIRVNFPVLFNQVPIVTTNPYNLLDIYMDIQSIDAAGFNALINNYNNLGSYRNGDNHGFYWIAMVPN